MQITITKGWADYELIDSGNGYRLERFGDYFLSRPDPQIIWNKSLPDVIWQKADAVFERTNADKGRWVKKNPNVPEKWIIHYHDIAFWIKLTPFKHTGVFPEQSIQWEEIMKLIRINGSVKQLNILNLFAYTGIASLAAASAGAKVTHVDASRPTIGWARENQDTSALVDKPIRWILEDALKFIQREIHRGTTYDGIILDPPAFGHGPDGKVWKFNDHFPKLLSLCRQVLSQTPIFLFINAYAISSSSLMFQNVIQDYFGDLEGTITVGELALEESQKHRLLSTGIFAKWIPHQNK